jgi:hypothetical protein
MKKSRNPWGWADNASQEPAHEIQLWPINIHAKPTNIPRVLNECRIPANSRRGPKKIEKERSRNVYSWFTVPNEEGWPHLMARVDRRGGFEDFQVRNNLGKSLVVWDRKVPTYCGFCACAPSRTPQGTGRRCQGALFVVISSDCTRLNGSWDWYWPSSLTIPLLRIISWYSMSSYHPASVYDTSWFPQAASWGMSKASS